MALISGSQTVTTANLTDLLDGGASALHSHSIADDSIVEAKLDVSNGPTNGQFLSAQSGEGGGLTWAAGGTTFIGVRVENSSTQSFGNNSSTQITFDASVTQFDTDTMHSSGAPTKITFTTAGKYWVGLSYAWSLNASGKRNVWVSKNNSATIFRQTIDPSMGQEFHNGFGFIYEFSAADYIYFYANQNSGGSLNLMADNESATVAMAYRIG